MPRNIHELVHNLSGNMQNMSPAEIQEVMRILQQPENDIEEFSSDNVDNNVEESSGDDADNNVDSSNDRENMERNLEIFPRSANNSSNEEEMNDELRAQRRVAAIEAALRVRHRIVQIDEALQLQSYAPAIIYSLPHSRNPSIRIHPRSGNFMPRMRVTRSARGTDA